MRIIEPYVTLESKITQKEALDLIESAGRVCYNSEDKINGVKCYTERAVDKHPKIW